MGRDKFLNTHTCLKIHPNKKFSSTSSFDPLWNRRDLLNHFNKNCVEIFTPCGVSSFDEITIWYKARCLEKYYIKNKPNPYGIRLYACVGWRNCYLHSICDNVKGNKSTLNASRRFSGQFPIVNGVLEEIDTLCEITKDDFMDKASCQWVTQMSLQTCKDNEYTGKRLFVMDNFYGRHQVGSILKHVTNGQFKILTTIKLLFINKDDKLYAKKIIKYCSKAHQGTWFLLMVTLHGITQEKCGYIIFKYNRISSNFLHK